MSIEQVLVRVRATALNIEDITVGAGEWPGLTLKPTKVDGDDGDDDDCVDNCHDDEPHIHDDGQASLIYMHVYQGGAGGAWSGVCRDRRGGGRQGEELQTR